MRYLAVLLALAVTPPLTWAQFDEVPQITSYTNEDNDWEPTEAQMAQVRKDAAAYFLARDTGNFRAAYAMFAPSTKAVVPYAAWQPRVLAINRRSGGITERTVRKITWFKDPKGRRGTLAAVDFFSESPRLILHCGFIVLEAQANGVFMLLREEENYITHDTAATMSQEDFDNTRATFGC